MPDQFLIGCPDMVNFVLDAEFFGILFNTIFWDLCGIQLCEIILTLLRFAFKLCWESLQQPLVKGLIWSHYWDNTFLWTQLDVPYVRMSFLSGWWKSKITPILSELQGCSV